MAPRDASAAPRPPAAPAPGKIGVRLKGGIGGKAPLELVHLGRRCAFLRPEGARRAARPEQWIRHVARDQRLGRQGSDHLPEAGAAVHRRAVSEPDDEPARARILRCDDELAEPSARRTHRVELVSTEPREADCSRRLDDSAPVGKKREARFHRPPERIGDRRRPPLPAERGAENLRRSLSAVGHRRLIRLHARPC